MTTTLQSWLATLGAALTLAAACLLPAPPVSAQARAQGDHVSVRWLAPDTLAAGETHTLGFYFEVDPEWHVYWHNAGDSGAAPRFDMMVEGAEAGDVQWPFPRRLPIEHLTNFGYEGSVAYLFELTPAPGAGSVSLSVELEWLVCKVDCIPGFGSLSLTLPVTETSQWPPGDLALVEEFAVRLPADAAGSPWRAETLLADEHTLKLTLGGAEAVPAIFPEDGALITATAPVVQRQDGRLSLLFERAPGSALPATTDFVVSDGERAWRLDAIPIEAAPAAPPGPSSAQPPALWLLLLAAFAGGVILNLMPCVFPVLSIKLFSLVQHGRQGRRLREGWLYTAGVLATFAALGAALLALRAGGAAIGWGFQLQSPPVVLVLIVLFWLMALAFSGLFEFGHRLMHWAGNARGGTFTTGVLAVFVAAPCTGPFMGAALGAAAVLPAATAMGIFLGLGAGLAAPFLLLTASPGLLRRLPAPGPWMNTLRQALAFPLYATVIWLLWVLGRLLGDSGWLWGSGLLLTLAFALWLGHVGHRPGRVAGWLLALLALALTFAALGRLQPAAETAPPQSVWQPYDREQIAQARAEGQAVFIDFTAAWCITCQVNKARVLDKPAITELFRQREVLAVRADWTRHDAEITRALATLGRNSVPAYAWYAPGAGEAELLPQLLTERMIVNLFDSQPRVEVLP